MNKETAIRIAAWFDGELSPEDAADVQAQVEVDPAARAYLKELRESRRLLQSTPVPVVGEGTWETFRTRLEAKPRATAPVLRFPRYATAAAAILALGMGIWWPLRKSGYEAPSMGMASAVYMVETELENATPVVYIDEPSGWTVVWVLEDEAPEQG